MDRSGRTQRFEPSRAARLWTPLFAAGGAEIWLFDGERRIERFELPR